MDVALPEVGERGFMGEMTSLLGGSWQSWQRRETWGPCASITPWFWSGAACFGPVASQELLSSILGHSSIPHLFVLWADQEPSLLNPPA